MAMSQMQIFVKKLGGKTITLPVDSAMAVVDFQGQD